MKARWSETALVELEGIFAYIHERNRTAATAVVERIEALISLLEDFPTMGHFADENGVRVLPVVRYPFLIFYTIDPVADEVVILHVRHGAQEPL